MKKLSAISYQLSAKPSRVLSAVTAGAEGSTEGKDKRRGVSRQPKS
jgi:hypothetical protein